MCEFDCFFVNYLALFQVLNGSDDSCNILYGKQQYDLQQTLMTATVN